MGGYIKSAVKRASEIYGQQNKLIHRALGQIGMPYEENKGFWMPIFTDVAGRGDAGSLSELTLGERYAIIAHLQQRGANLFNPKVPSAVRKWKKGDPDVMSGKVVRPMRVAAAKYLFVKKIHAILADMKLPWSYVDGIAKKRFGVEFVEWCEAGDLFKIVQMLSFHQKRHGGERHGAGTHADEQEPMEQTA